MTSDLPHLVLASGSPRRRALLEGLGVRFTTRPVEMDESLRPGETPNRYVSRLACAKAQAAATTADLVLAADTVVVVDDEILGKPTDAAEARSMLRRLAGRRHTVFTGVALLEEEGGGFADGIERTQVDLAALTEADISWYAATGEPLDKAGSYAIQGLGALFVEAVFGNYSNVVGLPLPLTQSLFRQLGFDLRQFRRLDGPGA